MSLTVKVSFGEIFPRMNTNWLFPISSRGSIAAIYLMKNESLDCVVLDPPYREGLFRRSKSQLAGAGTHAPFRDDDSNGAETNGSPKYHQAMLDLYFKAGRETYRVLRPEGMLIVKCQDEVSANTQ